MDLHDNLLGKKPQTRCRPFVVDGGHTIYFDEVVAGPQRPNLLVAPFLGPWRHELRVRIAYPAKFLRVLQVLTTRVTLLECPTRTIVQDRIQFRLIELDVSVGSYT